MHTSQLPKFHGLGTCSHPKKAKLLSSMNMWSLFFAFLPIFFFFFLSYLLGVLVPRHPRLVLELMTFLWIEFRNSILENKNGNKTWVHSKTQQAVA
jgi:hypothetical protein